METEVNQKRDTQKTVRSLHTFNYLVGWHESSHETLDLLDSVPVAMHGSGYEPKKKIPHLFFSFFLSQKFFFFQVRNNKLTIAIRRYLSVSFALSLDKSSSVMIKPKQKLKNHSELLNFVWCVCVYTVIKNRPMTEDRLVRASWQWMNFRCAQNPHRYKTD